MSAGDGAYQTLRPERLSVGFPDPAAGGAYQTLRRLSVGFGVLLSGGAYQTLRPKRLSVGFADPASGGGRGGGYHLLVVMRLGDVKARDKLMPLLACPSVAKVTLVRHARVAISSPKLRQVIHLSRLDQGVARMRPLRSLRNLGQCLISGIRVARAERVDAVLGFNFTPYGVVAWLIGRATRTPSLAALIGADFNTRLRQRSLRLPLRAVLRRCDRLTIFSEDGRQQLIAMGARPERVVVLPNTVDTDRYHPPPGITPGSAPGSAPGSSPAPAAVAGATGEGVTVDLIFTGYLIPRKGVDVLLRALALLNAQRSTPATLRIVGDGVQRPALETLSQELGLTDVVDFAGWSDDVAGALRRARVFVLLSEAEGLPIAMLEAMSSGLPAVVTDVGANAQVIRDGHNGYVVPMPADPALVADRLGRLLDDAELYRRCGAGALEVRQTHSYAHTITAWGRLLEEWLESSRS